MTSFGHMEQHVRVPDGTLSNQHSPYNVPEKDRQGPRDPVLVGGRMAKYQEAASVLGCSTITQQSPMA